MVRLRTVGFLQQGIRWPVPIVLASCASVALTVGLFVYAVDRGKLLGSWPLNATVAVSGSLFGMLGYWLPSFIHPFAFGLLTAAARPSGLRPAYRACMAWWAVNVAFEVGQHFLVREDHVVVGAGAKVLGPITLGRGARVGANSVVIRDVPAGATVVGSPAREAILRDPRVGQTITLNHERIPDPLAAALADLERRVADLEKGHPRRDSVQPDS